ncbi:hypothetical protein ACLB1Q_21065 [Escherichia coli]
MALLIITPTIRGFSFSFYGEVGTLIAILRWRAGCCWWYCFFCRFGEPGGNSLKQSAGRCWWRDAELWRDEYAGFRRDST